MTQIIKKPEHWLRGGSTADRGYACPGCYNEISKYPADDTSGPAAVDGTHSHTLLEHSLREEVPPSFFIGKTLIDHEGEFVVDQARANRVKVAVDYVEGVIRRSVEREGETGVTIPTLDLELFVDAGSQYGIPEWGGSCDVAITYLDPFTPWIEVIDYKDGYAPVPAETYQLTTYALGLIAKIRRSIGRPDWTPMTVTQTVIQPKRSDQPVSRCFSFLQFRDHAQPLIAAMVESTRNAPRATGDHCKYCPAAAPGRCKEYGEKMTVNLTQAFGALQPAGAETQSLAPTGALPLQVPEISEATSNEDLAALIDMEDLVVQLFKEARELALARAKKGQRIPGQKVVHATTQRRYVPDAMEKLGGMRLKPDVYLDRKLKSPKQLLESDAFKELSEPRRKKIEALIVKPKGALILVPESAPGEPVVFAAETLFKDVPAPLPPRL